MRIVFLLLLFCGTALAQPVTFRLKGQVPVGQKPQIEVTAVDKVAGVTIALARTGDGKKFSAKQGAMAKGQVVLLSIGDGAAGRASYKGTIAAGDWSNPLEFDTSVVAPIKVGYDAEHLDLDKRTLQIKTSRPVEKGELSVIGEDGKEIAKAPVTFKADATPETWQPIAWTQPAGSANAAKLSLRIVASDGAAVVVELVPWSVTVDHEDVSFATDSSVIDDAEAKKLDASLAKIEDVVKRVKVVQMQLYVAGHTDSVGPNGKNQKLSLARATSIARYFKKKGLAISIAVAGFGEEVLKVKTAQDVDERANRRADYVLGPVGGQPPFHGPYLKVKAGWALVK